MRWRALASAVPMLVALGCSPTAVQSQTTVNAATTLVAPVGWPGCTIPPPDQIAVVQSALTIELDPNPIAAGQLGILSTSIETTARATGGAGALWECWNGDEWVATHQLMRLSDGRPPGTITLEPGVTATLPAIALGVPSRHTIIAPEVAPGIYRISDSVRIDRPLADVPGHLIVEIVAPGSGEDQAGGSAIAGQWVTADGESRLTGVDLDLLEPMILTLDGGTGHLRTQCHGIDLEMSPAGRFVAVGETEEECGSVDQEISYGALLLALETMTADVDSGILRLHSADAELGFERVVSPGPVVAQGIWGVYALALAESKLEGVPLSALGGLTLRVDRAQVVLQSSCQGWDLDFGDQSRVRVSAEVEGPTGCDVAASAPEVELAEQLSKMSLRLDATFDLILHSDQGALRFRR